jgi:hypothetical protein
VCAEPLYLFGRANLLRMTGKGTAKVEYGS